MCGLSLREEKPRREWRNTVGVSIGGPRGRSQGPSNYESEREFDGSAKTEQTHVAWQELLLELSSRLLSTTQRLEHWSEVMFRVARATSKLYAVSESMTKGLSLLVGGL